MTAGTETQPAIRCSLSNAPPRTPAGPLVRAALGYASAIPVDNRSCPWVKDPAAPPRPFQGPASRHPRSPTPPGRHVRSTGVSTVHGRGLGLHTSLRRRLALHRLDRRCAAPSRSPPGGHGEPLHL